MHAIEPQPEIEAHSSPEISGDRYYLLETDNVIAKGEFDDAERLITRCRKDGHLPIDSCAEDGKRIADGIEMLDDPDIEAEANSIMEFVLEAYPFLHADQAPRSPTTKRASRRCAKDCKQQAVLARLP